MADSRGNRGSDDESMLPILGSLLKSVGICNFSEKQMQPSPPPPKGSFARWLVFPSILVESDGAGITWRLSTAL